MGSAVSRPSAPTQNRASIKFSFLESIKDCYEAGELKLSHVRITNMCRLDEHYELSFQAAFINIR